MNVYFLRILLLFPATVLVNSCGSSGQLTTGSPGSESCSFSRGDETLRWVAVTDTNGLGLVPSIGKTRLPDTFALFTIDEASLASFLKAAAEQQADAEIMKLPVPALHRCFTFRLQPSGILSKELAARFPGLISLKGTSEDDEQVTARIDYSPNTKLKAAITVHHQVFLIAPWPGKNRHYYLVYRKEDAGYEKIPYQEY